MRKRALLCSCEQSVEKCSFWGSFYQNISEDVVEWATDWLRVKRFFLLKIQQAFSGEAGSFVYFYSYIRRFYNQISENAEVAVIIDTSKHPVFLWALHQAQLDVYVLHLIRDPRDVVASWSRSKGYLAKRSLLSTTFQWILYNALTELMFANSGKYMRLRYEDFVVQPLISIEKIVAFLGEKPDLLYSLSCKGNHQFELTRMQHVLAGNPDKFDHQKSFDVRVASPHKHKEMGWKDRIVSILCWPFLLRYGYPLDE